MNQQDIALHLRQKFPLLSQSGDIVQNIAAHSKSMDLVAGQVLLHTGDTINYIPFLVSGIIKVARTDDDGHEMLLYYIHPGESCAFTLSASLKREKSKIKAIVQMPSTVILLPAEVNWQLARQYPIWYDFVLESYGKRFEELLELVEEIGFKHLDQRLETYLKEKFSMAESLFINLSHQEIADDLGTARVVISRMLKQMENRELVQLLRGKIKNKGLM